MLMEALAYISVLLVLLGVGFAAFYRCIDSSLALRRSADDLTSAIHAGERWRADIRSANQKVWLEPATDEPILHIPTSTGDIAYGFASNAVFRRVGNGIWVRVLPNAAASIMEPDPRRNVTAWRWELELQRRAKSSRIRPLFTFLAVPQPNSSQ